MSVPRIRVFGVVVILAAISAITGTHQPAAAATAPPTGLWTENSNVNVFKETLAPPRAATTINLTMARNEYEAAQIAVRKGRQFTIQRVTFGDLKSGKNKIAANNLAYQFVEFEYLDRNSRVDGLSWPFDNPVRAAPGDFPDALSNDSTVTVPPNSTMPIWVRAYVPAGTPAGVYTSTATVVTDAGNSAVPITVDVRNVTIPDSDQSTFTNTIWMNMFGRLNSDNTDDLIHQEYAIDKYSPAWWALMDKVAGSMRVYRQNCLPLPLVTLLLDGGSYLNGSTYHFDWSRVDQIVDRFMTRDHAVNTLEGFRWFYVGGNAEVISGTQQAPRRDYLPSGSSSVQQWNTQFLAALRDHVRAKGWENKFWMHIADEITDDQVPQYRAAVNTVHAIWPEARIADTTNIQSATEAVADEKSFQIPSIKLTNTDPDYYTNLSEPLWIYNAGDPTGSYLNRLIDGPAYAQREMMWYAYELGATGYLHWAYDNWTYTLDQEDAKGDGWIIKPDKEHGTIKPTIRLESLRDGIEDWELLHIVAQTKPALAKAISESLVSSATRYNEDTGFVTRMHNALVAAAAGGPVFATTMTKSAIPSASSSAAGSGPRNAIDGDTATNWKSAAGGSQWWQVDLTKQAQIDAVKLTWGSGPAGPYKVQLSYDGTKWADAYATTTGAGGDTFVAINGKARYLRIAISDCPAAGCSIADIQIGGSFLSQENLAGGKPYTTPAADPAYPDNGFSTDGVMAGHFADHRSYGYQVGTSGTFTATVKVDLQAVKTLGNVRIHRYQNYEQHYDPDSVVVSTSTDGVNYTQKATAGKANGQDGLWYDLTFPASQARYVQLTFTKNGGNFADWLFLDEIEAYAPPPNCAV